MVGEHESRRDGCSLALIVPALDGPPTGGTVYDAELVAALRRAGRACRVHAVAESAGAAGLLPVWRDRPVRGEILLVDSLYLEAIPELRRGLPELELGLLLHYLPSLLAESMQETPTALERAALQAVAFVVVPSPFLHELVRPLVGEARLCCIEPGLPQRPLESPTRPERPTAVMLSSVVSAKGVLALLRALAAKTLPEDEYTLLVAGRTDLEPAYAQDCQSLVARHERLRSRVELLGPLPHDRALELLLRADALLSASRMESYGMALGEARALGVPVLATAGGHSAAHVRSEWGGSLAESQLALAEQWLELVRSPEQRLARARAAQDHAPVRSWDTVAEELLLLLHSSDCLAR